MSSPGTPYIRSASPRSSMATRVVPSGTASITSCFTCTGPVVVLERFELQLGPRRLVHQLVGPCPDGFLLEAIRADLLIILRRYNPAGTAHVRGPKDHGEVQKGLFEVKTRRTGIDNLYALGLRLQHISLGAAAVFKAELHVLDCDRLTVVEFDPRSEPEGRALRVRGKCVTLG